MARVTRIPAEGEQFAGYVPAKRSIAHASFGVSTASPDLVVGDTAEYVLFNVSRPIVVFGLWTQTEEAWTTSVTASIGDSGTVDLFIADTTMAPASTGAVLIASTNAVPKVYAAAQNLVIDISGATAAAGLTHVYLDYAILED